MPGLLTHLIASAVGFLAVLLIFRNWKYGLVSVAGQLIPDTIKFGVTGLIYWTDDFHEILSHHIYWVLNEITHHVYIWIGLFVLVFFISLILYKKKKINKKKFKSIMIANAVFFATIIIHLILDMIIIEKSYWI